MPFKFNKIHSSAIERSNNLTPISSLNVPPQNEDIIEKQKRLKRFKELFINNNGYWYELYRRDSSLTCSEWFENGLCSQRARYWELNDDGSNKIRIQVMNQGWFGCLWCFVCGQAYQEEEKNPYILSVDFPGQCCPINRGIYNIFHLSEKYLLVGNEKKIIWVLTNDWEAIKNPPELNDLKLKMFTGIPEGNWEDSYKIVPQCLECC